MRKCHIIALAIICCISMAAFASGPKGKQSVLPSDILRAIEASDSVSWVLLDPMAPDSADVSYAIVGERLAVVCDSCEDRINALKSTLSYSKAFVLTNLRKESTFLPDVACVLSVGGESLLFSYSFYCDLCRFEYGGLRVEYDGERIREAILQIAAEVFPKDRYLRCIAGKSR